MKIRMQLGGALLAGGLLLMGCGQQRGNAPASEEQSAFQAEIPVPKSIITLDDAQQYYDLYSKRRVPLIQHYEDSIGRGEKSETRFDVARYVAFDYETLKQYMAYIEQEAGKVDTKVSSLRIYFGNNPNMAGKVHPKQNTVMLVPAVQPLAESEAQWGLYINNGKAGYLGMDLKPADPNATGIEEAPRSEASLLPALPAPVQGGGSLIMNEGSSAPPPNN